MEEYIINSFTRTGENTNLEVNNLNVGCITSKNNKFEIDTEGNIIGNSLTVKDIRIATQLVLDVMYPVGSVYISVTDTNPASYFGGQWEQIKDRFLLGTGDTYVNGIMGGEATHQLKANEMPVTGMIPVDSGMTSQQWCIGEIKTYAAGNYKIGRKDISAGAHNNMPPYLVVYIWKRIS